MVLVDLPGLTWRLLSEKSKTMDSWGFSGSKSPYAVALAT